jgi:hypothetical protein
MNAPRRMTDKEVARELFLAGYHQAIDDVALVLGVAPNAGILATLRAAAAKFEARAIIEKATQS